MEQKVALKGPHIGAIWDFRKPKGNLRRRPKGGPRESFLWVPFYGTFPKSGVRFLGVGIIRIVLFGGLYWGHPIKGNYYVGALRNAKKKKRTVANTAWTFPRPKSFLSPKQRCSLYQATKPE